MSTSYQRSKRSSTEPQPHPSNGVHGEKLTPQDASNPTSQQAHSSHGGILPEFNHNGHKVHPGIQPAGESGRRGIDPLRFLRILFRSSCTPSSAVNILWPFVPAAMALHWVKGDHHLWSFAISYIAMIPSANLLGFCGQEFARKVPPVLGTVIENTFSSKVEMILFIVLIIKDDGTGQIGHGSKIAVIQAAILGSIMANLLLCLGACFLVGGMKHKEQKFHPVVSEMGSGLLLVAAFALMIPSAFFSSLIGTTINEADAEGYTEDQLRHDTLDISRGVAIILLVSFFVFLGYNCFSHDHVFAQVWEADELADRDRHKDLRKEKLTMTEAVLGIMVSSAFVALIAVFLVGEIEYVVEHGVPDFFLGIILVPLVEKLAEHITTVDEAYDNQINYALYHCIGPSIQTALFNAPLVVIIGWGLDKPMDLNFEIFQIVLLVLSILVVGNFLRDGSSNWLEGALLMIVYVIIALTAWFYPNPHVTSTNGQAASGTAEHAVRALLSR